MDHETVMDLFSEYMEGDLDPERDAQVREHLAGCKQCEKEYEQFRATFETMRSLPSVPPPEDLDKNIKRRIRSRSRGKFFAATHEPNIVYRVPYEFISLILILIALMCLYVMTMITDLEQVPQKTRDKDKGSDIQNIH